MCCSRRVAVASLIAVAAFVYRIYKNVTFVLRPGKPAVPTNQTEMCTLYPGPWGAEDFVLTKRGGWAIFTSLDCELFPDEGTDRCHDKERGSGGLWAFNVADADPALPQRIDARLPDYDEEPCFLTHGLFLSNKTDRLYVVTHRGTRWSSVEVFKVGYPPIVAKEEEDGSHGRREPPPTLSWIRSVRSKMFPAFGLNSVVEGKDPGEIYVTLLSPFSVPETGRKHPVTILDRVRVAAVVPVALLGIKWSRVLRCTFDPDDPTTDAKCSDATGGKMLFHTANGIAISPDRETVFVCDMVGYAVDVFRRRQNNLGDGTGDGILEYTGSTIDLDYPCDNIEWRDESGELYVGSITDVRMAIENIEKPPEDRTAMPGGLVVASVRGVGGAGASLSAAVEWDTRLKYNHDGSKLSAVSFGMVHGGRIFLGSPIANGILVCREE